MYLCYTTQNPLEVQQNNRENTFAIFTAAAFHSKEINKNLKK